MDGVDIFLPSFNHARFLKQRIESILNQTHSNFDLYVFDDCSTDNSSEIIDSYRSDRRLRAVYISEQPSGSPFGNWHRFLPFIKKDFVWIAESDDYASTDFLTLAINEYRKNKNIGMVVGKSTVVDDQGNFMGEARDYFASAINPSAETDYSQVFDGKSVIRCELVNRNPFPNMSAVLFDSRILRKCLAVEYPRFYFLRDWLLYQQILSESNVLVIKRQTNFFRSHGTTTRVGEKPRSDWVRLMYERFFVCEDACNKGGVSKHESNKLLEDIFNRMSSRMNVSSILDDIVVKLKTNRNPIYIYGAGSLGDEICRKLYNAGLGVRIRGFIDRCVHNTHNVVLNSLPVYSPDKIDKLFDETSIIIASIEFRFEMVARLRQTQFKGQILTLDCEPSHD